MESNFFITWILGFILPIVVCGFYFYCQYLLSKKLEIPNSWMAWVPVLGIFNLVKIAGLSYWWILGLFIPLWNIYATIKIYGGISKRTGHGGWWTVGLFFVNWLFLPVTAFHYEKGDETNPRPFVGWKKFVLILLSIFLPITMIVGILAAALFPAMTTYLSRGRDTARMAGVKEISTALMAYQMDNSTLPTNDPSGCITEKMIGKFLLRLPKDPVPGSMMPGCNIEGYYSYRTGKAKNGDEYFVIGAKMETSRSGNSNIQDINTITPDTMFMRGSGNMYYIVY